MMRKSSADPNVKKTLVRNCEVKRRNPLRESNAQNSTLQSSSFASEKLRRQPSDVDLNIPTVYSTDALVNRLSELKSRLPRPSRSHVSVASVSSTMNYADNKSHLPRPISADNVKCGEEMHLSAEVTKKLNFPVNNKIYKNLIELNASIENCNKKREKKPSRLPSSKKDVEPNIKDFYEDVKEYDTAPDIPVIKLKFKPIKKIDNNSLHNLIASLEDL